MKSFISLIILLSFLIGDIQAQGPRKALLFTASSNHRIETQDVDADSVVTITGPLTIEFWAKRASTAANSMAAISQGGLRPAENQLQIGFRATSGVFFFELLGSPSFQLETDLAYTDTDWHHWACTFDNSNNVRIYRDGEFLKSGNAGSNYSQTDRFHVASFEGGLPYFNGTIDEVRLWSTQRSESDIRTYMCKKLNLPQSNLTLYYRMDVLFQKFSNEDFVRDLANDHDARLIGSIGDLPQHIFSGAAVGEVSTFAYTSFTTLSLSHPDGDQLTTDNFSGGPDGIHIYQVNQAPNFTTSDLDHVNPLRYWGVFMVGGTSYTVTYNYDGHPGINNENTLRLASRVDNSVNSWSDLAATLNTTSNTLVAQNQTATEYILGSSNGDNPLPVTLASFTAEVRSGSVVLTWITESEIDNDGFIVERSDGRQHFRTIAEIPSKQGNSTTRQVYKVIDSDLLGSNIYYYRLFDRDFNGQMTFQGDVQVFLSEILATEGFQLYPNYPNPFNPSTTISYYLPTSSNVVLTIFNVNGQEVKTLINEYQEFGDKSVVWDGLNKLDQPVSSGFYIYSIRAGGKFLTRTMMLMK
jgi:hypothetical protein